MKSTPSLIAMKYLLTLLTFLGISLSTAFAAEPQKPNIVFLLADDLGSGDLHCYGHPYSRTPNIDRLASEGTRFKQFYATGCTCCPSRTGFMTSKFPATYPTYPANGGFAERVTITELLKKAGYRTGHFGKWHIGPEQKPGTYGIDSIGADEAETKSNKRVDERGRDAHIYDQAIKFIEANKDKPFYVNVWGHISHNPVNPPNSLVDKWKNLQVKEEDFSEPMQGKFKIVKEAGGKVDDGMRRYLADVESLDDGVGRILKRLDELGLRENTIVVFSSDQGSDMLANLADRLEESTTPKKGAKRNKQEAGDSPSDGPRSLRFNLMGFNGNHRGGKHTNLEGGLNIPFIIRWPGHTPVGRVDEKSVLSGADWLPTLCALTGIKINATDFDGEDASSAWLGKDFTRTKPLLWKTSATGSEAVIREGDWKLISPTRKRGVTELYNIPADPFEKNNLAKTNPEVVKRLEAKVSAWRNGLPKEYLKTADKQD